MTTRRCSHCGHNGHNARTCPQRGVKIFGVRLVAGSNHAPSMASFKKSSSTEIVNNSNSSNSADQSESSALAADYASDTVLAKRRKKGVPWCEEEHRMFLVGLRAVGKGDWRAISRNFVPTRTPTQVASHAQKYFLRQSNPLKRKRRSSLFDIPQGSPGLAGVLESYGGFSVEEWMRYGGGFSGVSSSTRMPPVLAVVDKWAENGRLVDKLAENGRLRLSIAPPSPLAEAPAANLAVNLGSSSGSLIRVV